MTEDHAPGWWRASDGAWYPPERHHDPEHRARFAAGAADTASASAPAPAPFSESLPPPPPTPPGPGRSILPKASPRRGPGTILTVIAAVLVVIAVGVGSYLLAGGGGDDEPGGDDGPSTTTAPGGGAAVAATVDDISFSLPAGWVTAQPGSGETGEDRFPDDQPLAGAFDANLEQAEDQGALLFGLDTDLTSQSTLTVTRFEDVTLDEVTDGARASLEADPDVSIDVDRSLALAEGEGYLLRYRFPGGTGEAIGVQLLVPDGDDVYALVFSAADNATADDLVAIANSIVVE